MNETAEYVFAQNAIAFDFASTYLFKLMCLGCGGKVKGSEGEELWKSVLGRKGR